MIPIRLGATPNGYPTIEIAPPYELFGEFFRSEHSVRRAQHVVQVVDQIISGEMAETEVLQDYAVLTLRRGKNAHLWVGFLSRSTEEESEMPIDLFREIAVAWRDYVIAYRSDRR